MRIRKYFGTDGIRGRVGQLPITPDFILKLGWSVGKVLLRNDLRQIIIGKDTRISGYMLESSLGAGLSAAGLSTALTGPIPTPAIAYLTRACRASAGIVISASHNFFNDNGIKFFSNEGNKFSDEVELAIEDEIEKSFTCADPTTLGQTRYIRDATRRYIEFCKGTFPSYLTLKTLKIVVDCANGATYHIAPHVLRDLGATVIAIGVQPDGMNINKNCGSTDLRLLQSRVVEENADVGLAYDGDGDRIIMVDHLGHKVDGDQILYLIARDGLNRKELKGGVVGTIMSNMGLEIALKELGIPFARSSVGDRYILEMLREKGWRLGAENSGHVILLDKTTTGDGIIASLQVLAVMLNNNSTLYDLCSGIKLFPQKVINVCCNGNQNPLESIQVQELKYQAELKLQGRGRVLLRKSGTEPLIRIMVEGDNFDQVTILAQHIAHVIKTII
ncbi:phosphoglucosamine mutase [Candidatus Erwinia haradaeae]|uniref:Phosphoglucosamine mutase n=1 Tax=Candidatus Erwinia haradaeae TaxID=1922217 RepID=A0A803FU78_9GAMM|nr:phosphoglucosamine mutase [Candidatus Erwinia haradaeae]VFP88572.1 Phosphoglucosamine mutase [Candidatus Erwinia haradaeae]